MVAGGAAGDEAVADGFVGGAVRGAVGGVSDGGPANGVADAGAANGVAVTGAAKGVAVVGAASGVAVTGAAGGAPALFDCVAGPGPNGGVAVEGTGMAGFAAATGSCAVMTLALPGGNTTAVPSVVGTSANRGFAAAARLRAAIACGLFALNGGGSVGFLT